jgi:hypothetical protein
MKGWTNASLAIHEHDAQRVGLRVPLERNLQTVCGPLIQLTIVGGGGHDGAPLSVARNAGRTTGTGLSASSDALVGAVAQCCASGLAQPGALLAHEAAIKVRGHRWFLALEVMWDLLFDGHSRRWRASARS